MQWTERHIEKLYEEGKIMGYKINGGGNGNEYGETADLGRKKSKYGNSKVFVDGLTFDSKHEYHVYQQLKLRELIGEITELRLQVPYELNEGGSHSLKYVADFVYFDKVLGKEVVADAKGTLTKVYKKKRVLMLKLYQIEILEIYKTKRK